MISYDAADALIVVDLQNDFADPAGALSVAGGDAIVPFVNAQVVAARAGGALVAYTQDWHPEHTPHFAADGGVWPVHCVRNTWGAELHPGLDVAGPIVRKGSNGEDGYSGFTMRGPTSEATVPTELKALLQEWGAQRVVVSGLATDYCVVATALDAVSLGFETAVLLEGVRAVNLQPGDGEAALARLVSAGVTLVEGDGATAVPRVNG